MTIELDNQSEFFSKNRKCLVLNPSTFKETINPFDKNMINSVLRLSKKIRNIKKSSSHKMKYYNVEKNRPNYIQKHCLKNQISVN